MRTAPLALLSAFLITAPALAQPVIFNNGPFVTHPGGGFNGADASQRETGTVTSLGFNEANATASGPLRVADDFIISGAPPGGLRLGKMHFYGVQSTSGTPTTNIRFAAAYVRLYSGSPAAGGTLIMGDSTTNRIIASEWTGAYRVSTDLASIALPIMRISIDMSWIPPLADGTYWLLVSAAPDPDLPGTHNPQTILVTPRLAGTNGVQFFNSGWVATADYPFTLFGVACTADFNGAGGVSVQDIYDFLADWNSQASGGPIVLHSADFNGSGSVTVQDIYDFLAAWNTGCP